MLKSKKLSILVFSTSGHTVRRLGNYQVAFGGTNYYIFFILQCICNWKIMIINPPGATWYVEIDMFNPTPIKN